VWRRRSRSVAFGLVAAIFFALATAAGQWNPFSSVQRSLEVVGGRWLPALALSVLCTWLVDYGGIGPSFAYRFALLAFEWFSPILPNLDWPVLMAIGVIVPVVASWLVEGIYRDTAEGKQQKPAPVAAEEGEAAKRKRGWWFWASWALTLAVLAAGVLFFTGFAGFRMVTIDGISMEPAYSRGDVAVVREGVDPAGLEVGDVVLYYRGSLPVAHRIISIEEGEPDPTITGGQIEGKVVFVIPGVGYLNLWVRGR
jgi:signal peptidase